MTEEKNLFSDFGGTVRFFNGVSGDIDEIKFVGNKLSISLKNSELKIINIEDINSVFFHHEKKKRVFGFIPVIVMIGIGGILGEKLSPLNYIAYIIALAFGIFDFMAKGMNALQLEMRGGSKYTLTSNDTTEFLVTFGAELQKRRNDIGAL